MERDPTKFQAVPEDFIINGKKLNKVNEEKSDRSDEE